MMSRSSRARVSRIDRISFSNDADTLQSGPVRTAVRSNRPICSATAGSAGARATAEPMPEELLDKLSTAAGREIPSKAEDRGRRS